MTPASLALIVYSAQILAVVAAATLAERLFRLPAPGARLAYWRLVAALCLSIPFLATVSAGSTAVSVTFGELAISGAAKAGLAQGMSAGSSAPIWIWACGACAGFIRLLAGARRLRSIRRQSAPAAPLDAEIPELIEAIAPRAEIRWSAAVDQPVTFGVRRPVILVPRRLAGLEPDARLAIVRHELLHVQRRDWISIVIEEHLRALFWFHPGIWWLIDRIQLSREQLLDQLVVSGASSRRCYMQALLTFADTCRSAQLSSAFLRRRHLQSRLRELSKGAPMSAGRVIWRAAALAALLSGVTAVTVQTLPLDLTSLALQDRTRSRVEILLAETAPAPGLEEAVVSGSRQRIYLHPAALATDADVTSARAIETGASQFGVGLTFSESASARMARETAAHLGKLLAIRLDGEVVSAPTLKAPISSSAVISGNFTAASAQALAVRLAPVAPKGNGAARDRIALPTPIHQERPQYTQAAMAAHIEGAVLLETVVLADGSVGGVRVIRSLDSELGLDHQAVEALKQWTWKPGTLDGEPVRVAVQVEMTFTLK